jgi:hypothetical protein
MAESLFPQGHCLLVTSEPFCPMQLHRVLLQWRETRSSLALQRRNSFTKQLRLLLARGRQMVGKTALQRFAEIFEQMPFICHLGGLWSSQSGGCRIRITAIPAHDFNRRISFEPSGYRSRIPIRQEIKPTMPFQITDQCPVPMPTTPGPIIKTDHTRRLNWIVGEAAKQPQERIWATTHPQDGGKARALLSPKGQSQALQHFFESNGPTSIALSYRRNSFRKGFARANWL